MVKVEKLVRGENLTERVFELLRGMITSGELKPGTVFSATQYADKLGVSRTPVREAILQLEMAGLVRVQSKKGAIVLGTPLAGLLEVFQVRLMLEVPSASVAARDRTDAQMAEISGLLGDMRANVHDSLQLLRLDHDLHQAIARVAGNERVCRILTDMRNLVLEKGVSTTPGSRTGAELVDDHVELVRMIEAKDPDAAAAAMQAHLVNTAQLLISQEYGGDSGLSASQIEAWLLRHR